MGIDLSGLLSPVYCLGRHYVSTLVTLDVKIVPYGSIHKGFPLSLQVSRAKVRCWDSSRLLRCMEHLDTVESYRRGRQGSFRTVPMFPQHYRGTEVDGPASRPAMGSVPYSWKCSHDVFDIQLCPLIVVNRIRFFRWRRRSRRRHGASTRVTIRVGSSWWKT